MPERASPQSGTIRNLPCLLPDETGVALPKRGKMRGAYWRGIMAGSQRKRKHRRKGDRRRCQCVECLHPVASRASEKRWDA